MFINYFHKFYLYIYRYIDRIMESPFNDIKGDLEEMLNKFNGSDTSYHMRFKYNVF